MRKGARVPFAAFATVGTVCLASIASGLVHVACLPDADRSPLETEAGPAPAALRACGDGFVDPAVDGSVEECDPGDAAGAPGCSSTCRVVCEGGVIDPATRHCYFRLPPESSELGAVSACGDRGLRAHVVTFASDDEAAFIEDAGFLGYWVGLTYAGDLLGYKSASYASGEPGWSYPANSAACPGCYARTGDAASAYFAPLGPDGGTPECVFAATSEAWRSSPCGAPAPRDTLCEREPPGTRAAVCNGGICITLAKTQGKKRYLFAPSEATADDARGSCDSLGGHLVLLDTREEREQLSREIARVAGDDGASFWVGLAATDAGTYVWDDGQPESARPPVFGIDAGALSSAGRVFVSLRGTNPIDQGLGHADVPQSMHTYVCQY